MEMINTLSTAWWSWMSGMFWQVSLLVLLITLADVFLRNWAWPQVRYALWLLILAKLFIPPTWSMKTSVVSHIQPYFQNRIEQHVSFPAPEPTAERTIQHPTAESQPSIDHTPKSTLQESSPIEQEPNGAAATALSWKSILMIVWGVGIIALFSLLIGKIMRLRHWHAQQKEHDVPKWFHELLVETAQYFNLSSLPAIVFHPKAVSPAVYGMFRPVMLLPSHYFDNLSKTEAKHVLLHELAHLKRGDLWMNGAMLVMQILYWFNPLMIWVRRQMKHVREICCDLTVANVLREETPAYRQTLLNTARGLLTETVEPGLGLLGVFEDPFRLVTRLKWLEKQTWGQQNKIAAVAVLITLLVTVSVMPMAGYRMDAGAKITDHSAPFDDTFRITTRDGFYAVFLSKNGNSQNGCPIAVQECRELMQMQGIEPMGDPIARFYNDPRTVDAQDHYWQVGFKVRKTVQVQPPLEFVHLPKAQVAIDGVAGKDNTTTDWDAFIDRIQQSGYIASFTPAVEYYRGEKYGKNMRHYTQMEISVLHPDEGYPGIDIQFRETKPFTAVVLPVQGNYSQTQEKFQQLERYLKKKKIKPIGKAFAEYYSSWTESLPKDYEWIVGYPVENVDNVEPPFEIMQFDGKRVASAKINMPADSETPWAEFLTQLGASGHIAAGPGFELWSNPTAKTTDIEMQIAILSESTFENSITTQNMGDFIKTIVKAATFDKNKEQKQHIVTNNLRSQLEYSNQQLKTALLARDVEGYVEFLCDDVVIDPPMTPAIKGKQAYRRLLLEDIANGTEFRTFNSTIMDCWQCGNEIYEIGEFHYSLTTSHSTKPQVGTGSSMTIWQQDNNGILKIKYSMFTHTL